MEKVNIEELFSLKGKSVVITGGAGGIGRTIGNYMAAAGADIALLDLCHLLRCDKTGKCGGSTG